jgi:hypothetical protein
MAFTDRSTLGHREASHDPELELSSRTFEIRKILNVTNFDS